MAESIDTKPKPVKVCQNARAKICYKIEAKAVAIWVAAFLYFKINKQTNTRTNMKKFFIAAMCLVMALSSTSCANQASAQIDAPKSHDVGKVGDDFYIVTPAEHETIRMLVEMSFICESMDADLKAYDLELYANAINPAHKCLICKLKALKFFYYNDAYGDTTAECDVNDDFEQMLNTNEKLRALWETIEL